MPKDMDSNLPSIPEAMTRPQDILRHGHQHGVRAERARILQKIGWMEQGAPKIVLGVLDDVRWAITEGE